MHYRSLVFTKQARIDGGIPVPIVRYGVPRLSPVGSLFLYEIMRASTIFLMSSPWQTALNHETRMLRVLGCPRRSGELKHDQVDDAG